MYNVCTDFSVHMYYIPYIGICQLFFPFLGIYIGGIMDNLKIGKLLKNYRTKNKILQSDIAKITNKSTSAVSRYEKGEAEIPATFLIDFCNHFNVSINNFLEIPLPDLGLVDDELVDLLSKASNYEIEKIKNYLVVTTTPYIEKISYSTTNNICQKPTIISESISYSLNKSIPVRGYVAAGIPIEAIDNDLKTIDIPSNIDADYALIISGNSMYPLIKDGDYVFVKSCKELNNGDIGVFYYNGSVTCKKYFKNDSILKLISINPAFEDFTFSLKDQKNEFIDFTIEGKVILSESQKNNQ